MSTQNFAGRARRTCTIGLIFSIIGCIEFNSGDGGLIEEVASRPSDVESSDFVDMPDGFLFEPVQRYPFPICGDGEGCAGLYETAQRDDSPVWNTQLVVQDAIDGYCTTSVVRGLSEQLVAEVECMRPGTMSRIETIPDLSLGSAALPYLQSSAATSLRSVVQRGGAMGVNSTLRSLAQQYLIHAWYLRGRCGISLAASPGRSNHESGLAVDTSDFSARRWAFEREGWSWFGWADPVHFDYLGSDTVNLSGLSILAFQRLWNREHPEDQIDEDGLYGGQTRTRLARTPVAGFAAGTSCSAPTDVHSEDLEAIEVYWYRQPSGTYALRALASGTVVRVVYRVDGYTVGEATRGSGSNFPIDYSFSQASTERFFEVVGYSAAGREVAHGRGLLDVTGGTAVYIKQLGEALYEIGLERAPEGVAFVRVEVDGRYTLTDQISGQSLSARLAVRSYVNQMGNRDFAITTYNADGSVRGTLRRTFELR